MIAKLSNLPLPIQHTLIYASALALSKGFALVMVPVATHFLTPEDYGRLDVLQTLADLLSIVIGMGLAETLFRFAGSAADESERNKAAANIFGLALIIGLLALIFGQLAAPVIAKWLPGEMQVSEVRLILASLSLVGTILVPLGWLRMQGKAWGYFIGTAGRVCLQVFIAVPLLYMGYGVVGVLTATLGSAIVLSGWVVRQQYLSTGISFEFARFKAYTFYGGPLIFVGISGFILGSFDRWILASVVGTAEMAQYAVATKLGLMTAVLVQPFDLWWHAKRFNCLKENNGKQRCADIAFLGVCIAMLSALVITSLGPTLIRILTPAAYHGAIQYIPWLAGLAALHNITATLGFGSLSKETTVKPALIDGLAATIALIGYWLLIPTFYAWGAIVATTLALSLRLVAIFIISQKTLVLPYNTKSLIYLGAALVLALYLMPSQPMSMAVLAEATAVILSFCSLAMLLSPIRIRSVLPFSFFALRK